MNNKEKYKGLRSEVAKRLSERFAPMATSPSQIVVFNTMNDPLNYYLHQMYPNAVIKNVVGEKKDKESSSLFAIADNSVDLVVSNLIFYCLQEVETLFKEIRRLLKPNGLLFFSTFGPDTLRGITVREFMDMHHWGDKLLQASLRNPVVDVEKITIHYSKWETLKSDLLELEEHHWIENTHLGAETEKQTMTYEIIYGQAWGNEMPQQTRLESGEVVIPLSQIKRK